MTLQSGKKEVVPQSIETAEQCVIYKMKKLAKVEKQACRFAIACIVCCSVYVQIGRAHV